MDAIPYRIAVCASNTRVPIWPFPAALKNAPKASSGALLLKGLMLEMADGHTRPQMRNLPSMDGYEESITKLRWGQ